MAEDGLTVEVDPNEAVGLQPVLIILLVLAMAGAAYYAWRRDQSRQETLRAWALQRGWRVWPGGDFGPDTHYTDLKLFQRGHSHRAENIIRGEVDGRSVVMCDYRFKTGSGKNESTHRRGVAVLETNFPVIPLQIRREHAFDKVGEFLGHDDIDFESAEFSRTFYVTSPDRKWAYDILHARAMEYLLRQAGDFNIEFGAGEIAAHRRGHCRPEQYEQALRLLGGLCELVPDYVIKQMKGETP